MDRDELKMFFMHCRVKQRQPRLAACRLLGAFLILQKINPIILSLPPAEPGSNTKMRFSLSSVSYKGLNLIRRRKIVILQLWNTEWERVLLSWFSIRLWADNNVESTAVVVKYFYNFHKHSVCFISSIIFRQITNNNRNTIITILPWAVLLQGYSHNIIF